MRPQVGVFSVGITSKMIQKVLRGMTLPADFEFNEILINEDTRLPDHLNKYDVLLSSGNNAQVLKRKVDKAVITISPSLYDILLACSKSLEYCDTPVIVTYRYAFSQDDLKQLSNLLSVEIKFECYDRTDQGLEAIVIKHKEQGQTCIIGSGLICEYAEKHGIRGIYLFPEESIRTNLKTAAELAVSIFQKNNRTQQLSSVIANSKQGILMVDDRENIFLCNPIAQKYLGAEENAVVGQRLGRFLPDDAVKNVCAATEYTRVFPKIRGQSYLLEIIPIISKNQVSNRLLYLDDVNEIQRTERDIRREVWMQKGFIAKYTFDQYRSVNREFHNFLSIAKSFAKSEEPVVIHGETGVGKEMLAQSIHNYSSRAGKAFVAVNCAAIPENLLESELFGYSEGAFTGAKKGGKEGYFEMAHMGTIFLDEIGEMNPMLQSKLLRVVQEKQVLRVGGTKVIPFDARLIVATNRNLWQLVQDNAFRKDLYYRLNVLELEVPPLRMRPDDALMLFADFLKRLSPNLLATISPLPAELVRVLSAYHWPGNVRELENLAHMLFAHWQPEDAPEKMTALIEDILAKRSQRLAPPAPAEAPEAPPLRPQPGLLKSSEERHIRETLAACGGNIIKAAETLGIHRTTLWRKLKKIEDRAGEDAAPTQAS